MAYNRIIRCKQDAVGFIINVTLYEDDGTLVDLSDGGTWEVVMTVTTEGSSTALIGPRDMIVRNQVTNQGEAYYTMVAADFLDKATPAVAIPAGDYDIEIKATDPGGRVHFFPIGDGNVFGTFRMIESKG